MHEASLQRLRWRLVLLKVFGRLVIWLMLRWRGSRLPGGNDRARRAEAFSRSRGGKSRELVSNSGVVLVTFPVTVRGRLTKNG
jgi:hypothetical protein